LFIQTCIFVEFAASALLR